MEGYVTIYLAAQTLNVSPEFVVGLVEAGELPVFVFLPVCVFGAEHYVKSSDVKAWKARSDAGRDAALDELARLTQELGE